eukprot:CAMPEP_0119080718 /NCGR_PEP_ID=MMETSP1178-20130426/113330_1 /TAXON_ID=33656 /ORGANISM="unid sp, Strain CCMP2000" /LENGTH=37 /DNA_ID= /DNA_START= /DNA_END= /DNA_ORIENTATION=
MASQTAAHECDQGIDAARALRMPVSGFGYHQLAASVP